MTRVVQIIKRGTAPQQLVCFPFLGGYANSYYPLASALSDATEVVAINPPGHGPCQKTPLRSIDAMVDLYFQGLKSTLKRPCLFFGHSMGAIVALFLAHRVMESAEYPVKPSGLIVSAVNSPNFFSRLRMTAKSDAEICEYLISVGGIPEELQREAALLKYFAPAFRADFAALESVVVTEPIPKLDIPARILLGSTDRAVEPESIQNWQNYFLQPVREVRIEGGHMFVLQNASAVAQYIEDMFADVA